jgi:hypothetical protein
LKKVFTIKQFHHLLSIMYKTRLALVGLLLGSPLLSLAQEAAPDPLPRFYGGLGIYTGNDHRIGRLNVLRGIGTYSKNTYELPIQATLGYQLRPRLAVQLGLVYSGHKYDYASESDYTDANADIIHYSNNSRTTLRHYTASLQARYTLTRKLDHRFQVDVVGGFSYSHQYYRGIGSQEYTNVSQGTTLVTNDDGTFPYNESFISVGPSLRYRVGQRAEVVYDLLMNQALARNDGQVSMALGLRYRFGH